MPLFGSKKNKQVKIAVKEGLKLVKELKYQEAIDLLSEVNPDSKKNSDDDNESEIGEKLSCGVWAALGMAHQGLRQYEEAIIMFEKCLAIDKKRFEYLYGATICSISLENWEKARDYYYSLETNFGDMKIVQHLAPHFHNFERQHKLKEKK